MEKKIDSKIKPKLFF